MKKFILPLLLILSISMLIAVESEASDVVGYWKVPVPQNAWTPVAMPFEIVSGTPAAVFGDNWNSTIDYEDSDVIMNGYTLETASYYYEFGWDIDDPMFVQPGHWFWINRLQPQANTDLYLLGNVNPQPIQLTMKGQGLGGWTPFAINDAAPVAIDDLGFNTADPDWDNEEYDSIFCQNDLRSADYYGDEFGWIAADGLDFLIEPTKCYYYYSNQASNWTWDYPSVPGRNNIIIDTKLRRTK